MGWGALFYYFFRIGLGRVRDFKVLRGKSTVLPKKIRGWGGYVTPKFEFTHIDVHGWVFFMFHNKVFF